MITDGGGTATVGQSYSLTCSVSGVTVNSYQWRKDGTVLQGQTVAVLSFPSLTPSDAGQYSCEITVSEAFETFTAVQNRLIILQSELLADPWFIANTSALSCSVVPAPTFVSVTSHPASPIRPVGSTVTLTCAVMLSSLADVSVTVNMTVTGPGLVGNITQRVGSTANSYRTSTVMVSSFGRAQSGEYTCTATVTPTSQLFTSNSASGTARVTVGEC